MKKIFTILLVLGVFAADAQVVSRFTWSSMPLTTAATGPNGTSVSSVATSVYVGGSVGYAINPGLPTTNIDLIVPGSPYFDISSIDIDFYFRREESQASFFKRGSLFEFNMNGGYLNVKFTTTRGSTPGDTTISSGNIVALANDHAFHHYRFVYDNSVGMAKAYVDGVVVYTYNGVAGRSLSWTGAGNVIIGELMDATSNNVPVLGNMTIQMANSLLPVDLLSFDGIQKDDKVTLQWKTANENGAAHFVVERSANGNDFTAIKTVSALNNGANVNVYHAADESPLNGDNYYRLKMVDANGKFSYSKQVKINFQRMTSAVSIFPNPVTNYVSLEISNARAGAYQYTISTLNGNLIKAAAVNLQNGLQQVRIDLPGNIGRGTLIVRLIDRQTNAVEVFKIVKA
jgi:hypothetical protein